MLWYTEGVLSDGLNIKVTSCENSCITCSAVPKQYFLKLINPLVLSQLQEFLPASLSYQLDV